MKNIHLYPSPMTNESRMLRIARSLARAGVFDSIELVGMIRADLPADEPVSEGIAIRRLGSARAGGGMAGKAWRFLLWNMAMLFAYWNRPVDCINAHSLTVLPLAVLLKWRCGSRLIYDTHELETETANLGGFRKSLSKVLERSLIGRCDHVFFVGRQIELWYHRTYGDFPSTVIYNYPELRDGGVATIDMRDRLSISDGLPIFLYQGLVARGRGIDLLIEAFAGLSGTAHLVVLGFGPLAEAVQQAGRTHGNIHFLPAAPPDQVLAYSSAANYGLSIIEPISLSYEMCMPNKVFEYVQAGLGILVSPCIEQAETTRENGIGVVTRGVSPTDIRDGVHELLAGQNAKFSENVRQAAGRMNWQAQEENLLAPYRKLFRPASSDHGAAGAAIMP
jgi:glycosyltransferase involved in cell wall biosynthesis